MKFVSKITVKITFIALLIIILLIPLSLIQSVIIEREIRRNEAVVEVSHSWGHQQNIIGPILTVPYQYSWKDHENVIRTVVTKAHFLPDHLQIKGSLFPEVRYRGIYEAVLYRVILKISGKFSHPRFQQWKISNEDVMWNEAFISIGIPDMRGIKGEVEIIWNQQKLSFHPGANDVKLYDSGMHAKISGLDVKNNSDTHTFEFNLALNGSEIIHILPLGKETKVEFSSLWPHPSFTGAFLPTKRDINTEGFKASWELTYFGRSYPQQWKAEDYEINKLKSLLQKSAFGVKLLFPVDAYQKSERSVKYGILFITLTFLAFFLFEVLGSLRIHPLQYLLVGFANCLFYLLLISLSEHLDFLVSYMIASGSTIVLISGYVSKILKSKKRAIGVAGILLGLYTFLYILLQIQDYALLLGTIGLFLILSFVMYITRGIDWDVVNLTTREDPSSISSEDKS